MHSKKLLLITLFLLVATLVALVFVYNPRQQDEISFNEHIRPILNENCLACHGGVKKESGFSMLFEEEAFSANESGKPAIIPGNSANSEMIRRITHQDPEIRMPPEGDPLSEEEIAMLEKWIDQGAEWETHWSLIAPEKQNIPGVREAQWTENEIDQFILAKLEKNQLSPSSRAGKSTLLRRVSLDLTGIPPTIEELESYLNDSSENAYEKQVDRLLDSPDFGEKWASMWLDLARYADSKGYEKDAFRSIWKFRDYVIESFNEDKPFDQFTIEQLAGDLLQNPSDEQLIATAFHRNTMNNDEGGTDDEEFRVASVIDRVNTTFEVWQGLTIGCVQCHSHPYDPFKHREYYQLMAFFNNTADADVPSEAPNLKLFAEEDQQKLSDIKNWIHEHTQADGPNKAKYFENLIKITEPKIHPNYFDSITNGTRTDGKYLAVDHGGFARMRDIYLSQMENVWISYSSGKASGTVEFRLDSITGKKIGELDIQDTRGGWRFKTTIMNVEPAEGFHDIYLVFNDPGRGGRVCLIEWLMFTPEMPGSGAVGYDSVQTKLINLLNAKTTNTPIMIERPDYFNRETRVFERGNWMVHGDEVNPETPGSMYPIPKEYPQNRLGLAQWLVNENNPLTSRVIVNRIWEQIFGIGIIETVEDLGSQGEPPSHPQLLDHLAWKLMHEHQWHLKKLIKEIVMSATYQQSSKTTPELIEKDPYNRLLARGPRFRLSAEQVRDQALAVSGLLSDKMYGPSVMPPQPDGVWQVIYSGNSWQTSEGEDKHRRGLYTFWRRTTPYPSMVAFDSPSREFCVSRRIRTNTPLQAFVTLNDTVYFEAAKALASRMNEKANTVDNKIAQGYKMALLKDISKNKLDKLANFYHESLYDFEKTDPANVEDVTIGYLENSPENAALVMVANVILNLDEFLTKE